MLTLLEIWNGFGNVEVNLIMLNLLCESQDKPLEEDEETVNRRNRGIKAVTNGRKYEKIVVEFLTGKMRKQKKEFDREGKPYYSYEYICRKRLHLNQIVERGLTNYEIHRKEDSDLDIPHLNLKIEVKGSKIHYSREKKEGKVRKGAFRFYSNNFNKHINLYAFVFGISKRFVLFLTKREINEVIGRTRIRNLKTGKVKYLWVEPIDIYDKALGIRDIYNY